MRERSNAELERFAVVAAHELKEPLRAVAGHARLLGQRYQGRLGADADELIGFVTAGVARMEALVDALLAYARAGPDRTAHAPVPAEEAADRAVANLRHAIDESGATVERGPLPVVRGDAAQLVQLFQNLVGNAVKFRAARPPLVRISAERSSAWWRFAVADNGIGVEPRLAQRAFDMFQRLHGRGEYPGTGIGLAVCARIVAGHGGAIWLEPAPGSGTTCFFTLPACRPVGPAARQEQGRRRPRRKG
ncbi:MAG TPA: ATP-binding protein [Actinomycetota bacterium]|nr:ATP-binding protein [Actinomycetota bacterium]